MKLLDITQGSALWRGWRADKLTGSVAPVIMDDSPYQSRFDYLTEVVTGEKEAPDDDLQALFQRGHEAEAAARPLVESQLSSLTQEEITLAPACCEMERDQFPSYVAADTVDALDGKMAASLDGLSQDGKYIFEHKILNKKLIHAIEMKELPPYIIWQLEHNLLVSGAQIAVFACSDGTEQTLKWIRYTSSRMNVAELLLAWQRFLEDKAAHQQRFDQWCNLEKKYGHLLELKAQNDEQLKRIRSEMEAFSNGQRVGGKLFSMSWTTKPGSVKWQSVIESENLDISRVNLDKYRGAESRYSTIKQRGK